MILPLAALGCVILFAAGQIVFKVAADAGAATGTFLAPRPAAITLAAFAMYGVASILWILLLQRAPLSRIYPFAGLAFVIVPVAAHFVLGDAIGARHLVGSVVIAVGVVVVVSA